MCLEHVMHAGSRVRVIDRVKRIRAAILLRITIIATII